MQITIYKNKIIEAKELYINETNIKRENCGAKIKRLKASEADKFHVN